MRILTIAALIAAASATTAFAAPARVSDSDFLKANRCLGLASTATLGADNADSFKSFIKAQSIGRNEVIVSMGKKHQAKAASEARGGNDERRTALKGELDGACQSLIG
ncbi:MAG: hypothetical protein KA105_02055 [Caulobacter sp.]|nr:hypothetical protein [Caulobacter sp.]